MNLKRLKSKTITKLFKKNDVSKASIFGSVSRGEDNAKSDIDILIEFSKEKSLLKFVALERRLSRAFKRKVDLQSEAAISPYIIKFIKKDMKVIYEHGGGLHA
ncbi:MAG: nucleotidyltransferase family protein [Elusimicrobiota bacterium]